MTKNLAKRLNDKVCIITRSANGIGFATAQKFCDEGGISIICDMNAEQLQSMGGQADGFVMNVTDRKNIDEVVAAVTEKHGRIDVLINNAGIIKDARLVNMTEAHSDAVIDVNLKGLFNCTQAVVMPHMLKSGKGSILSASSAVGLYSNFGQTNYAATKYGVIGFTTTWVRELGPKGIRANAVCPSFVETSILASMLEEVLNGMKEHSWLRRLGKPEEVANVYAFFWLMTSLVTSTVLY